MSGIIWHIITFGALGIFLAVLIYRTVVIVRLPIHLRWELAPIPYEKSKRSYGGSYLEEYEWWRKPRRVSHTAQFLYMATEILLMRGVWKHNRALWPFSFALHTGIYLVILMLLLQVLNAIFIITGTTISVRDIFLDITLIFAFSGYLLGLIGASGLIIMRTFYADLRSFSTISAYFKLIFLAAVFGSGIFGVVNMLDFIPEMSLFIRDIFTIDTDSSITFPLSLHIIISLLFIVYLPLTDMLHFITKYFTYHEVRWNDRPQDAKMTQELKTLLVQPVTWTAPHVISGKANAWEGLAAEKKRNEEEP